MGLDLFHLQLTNEVFNEDDFLYADKWEIDCNVPLKFYSDYITDVPYTNVIKEILVVENENELNNLEHDFINSYDKVLFKNLGSYYSNEIFPELKDYIYKEKLEKYEIYKLRMTYNKIDTYSICFEEQISQKGMYYIDIGYQRHGMNGIFYNNFEKYPLWGNREDFLNAYNCLDDTMYADRDAETLEKMQKYFKECFLDNYIYGKSLLSVSL